MFQVSLNSRHRGRNLAGYCELHIHNLRVSSNLINIVEMKYGGEDKRCWVRGEILGEMVKGMGK